MNKKRLSTLLRIVAVLAAAALLLVAGAVLAQYGLPATEGGDQLPTSFSFGAQDGEAQTPDQPADGTRGTEGGEAVEFISLQGYAEGMAPDDNIPQSPGLAPSEPQATFTYYTVSGPELQPRTTTNVQVYNANGCIYMSTGTSTGLLTGTGLHIPDDSVIKYIRLYYNDTNASAGVDAFLTRYAPGSGTADLISTGSTNAYSGGYGFVVSNEITHTVNNDIYAYMLYGWPDANVSSLQVCGIRVAYYAPPLFGLFLPSITR
jgi:hypothetical protein